MVLKKGTPGEIVKKESKEVRRRKKNKEAPKKYYTGFLGLSKSDRKREPKKATPNGLKERDPWRNCQRRVKR